MSKKSSDPLVSIVVPTVNQADMTVRCFNSIRQNTVNSFEILWVDNGSSEDQIKKVKPVATGPGMDTKLIKFDYNSGFVQATNAGIREARGKIVVLLNNDTEVTHRWDQKLIAGVLPPEIGAVGPVTQSHIAWQEASALNKRWNLGLPVFAGRDVQAHGKLLDQKFQSKYIDIGVIPLAFFCVAIRMDTIKQVGLLDEDFGVGFGDDDEYCARLRHRGYKNRLSLGTFVFHHHRATFKSLGVNVDSIRRENIKTLKRKVKAYGNK